MNDALHLNSHKHHPIQRGIIPSLPLFHQTHQKLLLFQQSRSEKKQNHVILLVLAMTWCILLDVFSPNFHYRMKGMSTKPMLLAVSSVFRGLLL
jgi:hypothetical protein